MATRFRESEMYLRGVTAEKSGGDAGVCILLLQHVRNSMRNGISKSQTGGVPSGADDTDWRLATHFRSDHSPRSHGTAKRLPVFPGARAIERVKIEQLERKTNLRQHIALDTALSADEEWLDPVVSPFECPSDSEARVEMSTRAATCEDQPHREAGSARKASGFADAPRNTLSRELPMLTRIPVMTSERTRFERP